MGAVNIRLLSVRRLSPAAIAWHLSSEAKMGPRRKHVFLLYLLPQSRRFTRRGGRMKSAGGVARHLSNPSSAPPPTCFYDRRHDLWPATPSLAAPDIHTRLPNLPDTSTNLFQDVFRWWREAISKQRSFAILYCRKSWWWRVSLIRFKNYELF